MSKPEKPAGHIIVEPEYQADIERRMDLATQPTKRDAVAKTKNKLDDPNDLPLFALTEPAE